MNTLVLKVASRFLITVILLYSIFLFIRGHDYPGGGFIGGLAMAASWSLLGIAYNRNVLRSALPFNPMMVIATGMLAALMSGLIGPLLGEPFLTGVWVKVPLGQSQDALSLGTPLLFDLGVYLIVFGTIVNIVMNLEERE